MTTTQTWPRTRKECLGRIGVGTVAPEIQSGAVTIAELDLGDQSLDFGDGSASGFDIVDISDVQQMPATSARPQLKIMNPECPVRYIPIHIWPERLKKAQPRTGRRYCPKRSRTLPKRNGPSPLVREYQCTEDEDGPLCEDQVSSDAETIQFGDDEDPSTALAAGKRRGWGHTLLDVMQNAVQKRQKEQKKAHSTLPRTSLSLPPIRLGHRPPGLKRPGSRESIIKWQGAGDG